MRGDLLGRIADHDRADRIATEAIGSVARCRERALHPCAARRAVPPLRGSGCAARSRARRRVSGAGDRCRTGGTAPGDRSVRRGAGAARRLAKDDPGIHTLGALASLLAEMDRWAAAEARYAAALDADTGVSPLPCGQLLFEWGVSAMRRGDLDRAEALFAELDAILPQHVPGRGHRAEVALARGQLDVALALIAPLLEISDDPEYRATYAEILAARGERASGCARSGSCGGGLRAVARAAPRSVRRPRGGVLHGHRQSPAARRRPCVGQLEASRYATLAQSAGQGAARARSRPHDARARRAGGRHGSRAVGPGSPRRDRALCRRRPGTELEDRRPVGTGPQRRRRSASGSWCCWRATRCRSMCCPPAVSWPWASPCSPSGSGESGRPGCATIIPATASPPPWAPGHGHAAFAVGTLHGLAGSSHLLGIVPALALPSDARGGRLSALFGMGSVAAMGPSPRCRLDRGPAGRRRSRRAARAAGAELGGRHGGRRLLDPLESSSHTLLWSLR